MEENPRPVNGGPALERAPRAAYLPPVHPDPRPHAGPMDAILEHVAGSYFEHYAAVAYVQDVQVVRGDKYL